MTWVVVSRRRCAEKKLEWKGEHLGCPQESKEQGKTVIDTAKDEKLQEMLQNTKEKLKKVPELSNTPYGYGITAEASTLERVSQVGEITKRPETLKGLWFVYFKEPEQNEENAVGSLTKQWAESLFINEEITLNSF